MAPSLRQIRSALVAVCLGLGACSTRVVATNEAPVSGAQAALPRPTIVLVRNFALDPTMIRIDTGFGGTLRRTANGVSADAAQQRDAEDIQRAITDTLVKQIGAMGLDARLDNGAPPPPDAVVVDGAVTSANEGNRTRRTVVGLGAGRSSVSATAEVSYLRAGAPPQVLATYRGDSNSGRMPGLGVGAAGAVVSGSAVGLAIGAGAHALTQPRTEVGSEAQRMARRLSVELGGLFARQGWIPPSAVPSPL